MNIHPWINGHMALVILLLGLAQEGFMQQGDVATPCLLAPKRLCLNFVQKILNKGFFFVLFCFVFLEDHNCKVGDGLFKFQDHS